MRPIGVIVACAMVMCFSPSPVVAQARLSDSAWKAARKNIVRYNLSSAAVFGFDNAIIFGYERLLSPKQSFSINIGQAGLPKVLQLETDSFRLGSNQVNSGLNLSADYRFYLAKENRYPAPRGVYIGPFYAFNRWKRENDWEFTGTGTQQRVANTKTDFTLHTLGFELGYQFIFWDRLALDMVLIGPGIGWYDIRTKAEGNLTEEEREQLLDGVTDLLQQRFPGMNIVLDDESFNANGRISTTSIGFRYLLHIGFRF
jgi:hypothetical protein